MEYSQDHFSFNALGEQRGGEEDDVFFFSWISKHGEEDLHAELGPFLFMGVCQTIIEDSFTSPCIFLLPTYGEIFFLYPLTISWQCIVPQEGKLFIELHELHWAKLHDGDSHLLCGLGKRCFPYMWILYSYD